MTIDGIGFVRKHGVVLESAKGRWNSTGQHKHETKGFISGTRWGLELFLDRQKGITSISMTNKQLHGVFHWRGALHASIRLDYNSGNLNGIR